MSFEQAEQYCSKVLRVTRYHRSAPCYIDKMGCYVLFINEKLLLSNKTQPGLLESGQVVPVLAKEVMDFHNTFKELGKKTMENENKGNKPLFIAAGLLVKATNEKSRKYLNQVLVDMGNPIPEKEKIEVEEVEIEVAQLTPPHYTGEFIGPREQPADRRPLPE
ncbi:hypothetical protein GINT2_001835 [Glugoides intestinalis]